MSKDENANTMTTPSETEKDSSFDDDMGLDRKNETKLATFTNEQKGAFQLRAIQKFQDFIDYVKIISDQKVDDDFREHSMQLSLELFINDSTLFSDTSLTDTTDPVLLKSFLTDIQTNKKPIYIKVLSIDFATPINTDSINNYRGNIETTLKIYGEKTIKNVDVFLVKVQKDFGNKTQVINEVRLGNIY
jgi:hypothetical protein